MSLATPYALPFDVEYARLPLLSQGHGVQLQLTAPEPPSPTVVDLWQSLLLPFVFLGEIGALAGAALDPAASTVGELSEPAVSGPTATWTLARSSVDDRSLAMLAHLLQIDHASHHLTKLVLTDRQRQDATRRLTHSSETRVYPERWPRLAFDVDVDDEVGDFATIDLEFAAPVTDEAHTALTTSLMTWATATSMGAYGIAPVPPEACGLAILDEPLLVGASRIEWGLGKSRMHPSAWDGLLNTLGRVHAHVAPLRAVRIA